MPGPLLPEDDRAPGPRPAPDPGPPDRPDRDARGDDLALQLPAWDLVPPAEFVVRHRRQR